MADEKDEQGPKKDGQAPEKDGQDAKKDDKDQEQKGDKNGKDDAPDKKRKPLWPWLVAGVLVLGFVVAVLVIIYAPSDSVWTDDAYVTAHYATVAPRISGQVSSVDVDDNQTVRAGQVLSTLDDRDYRTTLATDEAMLARDQAQADDIRAQIDRLPSQVAQSQSSVASSGAQLTFAQQNAARYRNLASTGAGSFQERQQADMSLRQAQASLDGSQAQLSTTRHQLPILQAQYQAALGTIRSDRAQVEQARLNLSYTRILAPLDGTVAQREVQVGNFVGPGAALMALVPLNQVYIVANYREVSLAHVLPGQHARIHVDAYNLDLDGVVDSVPPGAGTAFSPIQPNNATGNFTKIVQRLPVKILVSPGQNEAKLLRIGFSVEITIHTGQADVKGEQNATPQRLTAR